jgi:AAA+ ATPase superfamily predicted ATPase
MTEVIVSREAEKKILKELLISKDAELLAILGRRRVGKTYLIRNYSAKQLAFECTGIHDAGLQEQLLNFTTELQRT